MGGPIVTVEDARAGARARLPRMVFDYIDGAAGEEYGLALARARLRELRLRSRVLVDVRGRDLSVPLFGRRAGLPFGIAPMGMCNLARPGADLMLARMAARRQIPVGASTMAATALEAILEAAEGWAWFQLYWSGDGTVSMRLLERARAAGCDVLVVTLDVPELGRRPRELRRGLKMPFRIGPRQALDLALHPRWSLATLWSGPPGFANFRAPGMRFDRTESRAGLDRDGFARLRDAWPGRLVAKGVLDPEDALMLRQAGADAIQVSSHGGRQLDSAVVPLDALRAIRAAVGPDFPLFYDTGLRNGEEVVKVLAAGADFAFLGRPFLWGVAAAGAAGLEAVCALLAEEVDITLAQIGRTAVTDLAGTLA